MAGTGSAVPAWAEPVKGGWVLRLHGTLGRRGSVKLGLAGGATATPVDMLGRALGDAKAATGELALPVAPYQLRSALITR